MRGKKLDRKNTSEIMTYDVIFLNFSATELNIEYSTEYIQAIFRNVILRCRQDKNSFT